MSFITGNTLSGKCPNCENTLSIGMKKNKPKKLKTIKIQRFDKYELKKIVKQEPIEEENFKRVLGNLGKLFKNGGK